ncbi:MAG: hypothetical protein HRT44_05915 [Bdellovibrionales bacterium]|nr:hypothetical protein [Bdellovibrionales bacterium]
MSYGLLSHLEDTLSESGHNLVAGRSVCGATISDYLSTITSRCNYRGITNMQVVNGEATYPRGRGTTQDVRSLTREADSVVVQLGDNHLGSPENARRLAQNMARSILREGKECVWIGPASAVGSSCGRKNHQKKLVSEAIRAALNSDSFVLEMEGRQCRFVNSHSLTSISPRTNHRSTRDCLHYSNYEGWADSIEDTLIRELGSNDADQYMPVAPGEEEQPEHPTIEPIDLDEAFTSPLTEN